MYTCMLWRLLMKNNNNALYSRFENGREIQKWPSFVVPVSDHGRHAGSYCTVQRILQKEQCQIQRRLNWWYRISRIIHLHCEYNEIDIVIICLSMAFQYVKTNLLISKSNVTYNFMSYQIFTQFCTNKWINKTKLSKVWSLKI